jgi:hypothetical protein
MKTAVVKLHLEVYNVVPRDLLQAHIDRLFAAVEGVGWKLGCDDFKVEFYDALVPAVAPH